MVSDIQSVIGNTNTDSTTGSIVPLPPPPSESIPPTPSIPPVIHTDPSQAGSTFGQSGTRHPISDSTVVSGVSIVSINGRNYNDAVFDANGRHLKSQLTTMPTSPHIEARSWLAHDLVVVFFYLGSTYI